MRYRRDSGTISDADLGTRWTTDRQSKIEVVSDVNDCDLRRLPRPVFKDNSRFMSVVTLPSLSSYRASRARVPAPELQADLQGAADLQAGQEWPFLFIDGRGWALKSLESTEKSGLRVESAGGTHERNDPDYFERVSSTIQESEGERRPSLDAANNERAISCMFCCVRSAGQVNAIPIIAQFISVIIVIQR